MKPLTKGELISQLQSLPCSDDTPVNIFDHRKVAHTATGDGDCDGVYADMDISFIDQWAEMSTDEKEYHIERFEFQPMQFIAISFDNEDYED